MAKEIHLLKPGFLKSDADLSALNNQFRVVKITADDTIGLAGAGEFSFGILQNTPILGEAAEVEADGISKGRLATAVAFDAKLMSDANGRLLTATSGNHVIAHAMEAGGALDVIITVRVLPTAVPLA